MSAGPAIRILAGWLYRLSHWYTIVLVTALYALFIATVMPQQAADSRAYAGEWGAPDGHIFYTPDRLYAELSTWDAAGRDDYIRFRLGLDFVWAIAYAGFLLTISGVALRFAYPDDDRRRLLILVPLVPMLCDYIENFLGIALVANADTRLDWLAWIMATVTALKWLSLVLAHLVMLYALGASLLTRLRPR